MTENAKTNKISNSRAFWIVVSLLASFLLWAYMSSTEDTTIDKYFSDVPVTFQGAEELRTTKGLIITNVSTDGVTVKVSGSRANIGNLHASDLQAIVDVSGISQARDMQVSYTIQFPDRVDLNDADVVNKSPETIQFSVVKERSKTVEVRGVFTGSVADGYMADPIVVEPATITLYGPEDELANVGSACVYLDRENVDATIGPINSSFVLLDNDGNELAPQEITSDHSTVSVTLPILMTKEVQLAVNLLEGAGATAENSTVTVEPQTIQVAGDPSALEELNKLVVGTVNLADFALSYENTFTIPLDNALRNLSGTTEATVKITISGLETKKVTANNISLTGGQSGVNATLQTTLLEVTIRAPEGEIDAITADHVRIVADLSDYDDTTGTITVPAKVYVDGYENAGAVGAYSVSVTLTTGGA